MELEKRAVYYGCGALGALLLAGTMAAGALSLVSYLPGGAVLALRWPALAQLGAALRTVGGIAAVWAADAAAVGLALAQARAWPIGAQEEAELGDDWDGGAVHAEPPRQEKAKVTI